MSEISKVNAMMPGILSKGWGIERIAQDFLQPV